MQSEPLRLMVSEAEIAVAEEIEWLSQAPHCDGAVATFIGKVRDDEQKTIALELEHYPGMTEKALRQITQQARQRWDVNRITVIHRVGRIALGDNIVFVGVTSSHRADAFAACEFLMDYLKASAPFWKKAITGEGSSWVGAKDSDQQRAKRWET
jgi:molybdopterin synthase catalytic subunit